MEPTPYEIRMKIPLRCLRAYRAVAGHYGMPREVVARDGWWHHDDVIKITGHADDARKLRLLHESVPGLLVRREMPREGGLSPIALFRLAAEHDPMVVKLRTLF